MTHRDRRRQQRGHRTRPALRRQLIDNARRLYTGLADLGFSLGPEPSPIVSALMPNAEAALNFWTQLLEAGLYTNVSLPPATPKGLALLRSSVSAAHTREQIDRAVGLFGQVGRAMDLVPPAPARAGAGPFDNIASGLRLGDRRDA